MMNKYTTSERKVDFYDIGDGMTLMNIVTKNESGKTKAVHTCDNLELENETSNRKLCNCDSDYRDYKRQGI